MIVPGRLGCHQGPRPWTAIGVFPPESMLHKAPMYKYHYKYDCEYKHNKNFKMLGTGLLSRHALQNAWDRPHLGTGPSKCLGQARSWDRPFKMLGTGPLLGQALQNAWDRPPPGTSPLGEDSRGKWATITSSLRAPENMLHHPYTKANDVWGLGCTLAELEQRRFFEELMPGRRTQTRQMEE